MKTPGEEHSARIRRELETVRAMLTIFCQNRHGESRNLCADCAELFSYTEARVGRCPFADDKPTCNKCTVHCFSPAMRERIKEVMRFSGPRMPLRHPLMAIIHFVDGKRPMPERKRPKA